MWKGREGSVGKVRTTLADLINDSPRKKSFELREGRGPNEGSRMSFAPRKRASARRELWRLTSEGT